MLSFSTLRKVDAPIPHVQDTFRIRRIAATVLLKSLQSYPRTMVPELGGRQPTREYTDPIGQKGDRRRG